MCAPVGDGGRHGSGHTTLLQPAVIYPKYVIIPLYVDVGPLSNMSRLLLLRPRIGNAGAAVGTFTLTFYNLTGICIPREGLAPAAAPEAAKSGGTDAGVIAGVVGGVCGAAAVAAALLVWLAWIRKRKARDAHQQEDAVRATWYLLSCGPVALI